MVDTSFFEFDRTIGPLPEAGSAAVQLAPMANGAAKSDTSPLLVDQPNQKSPENERVFLWNRIFCIAHATLAVGTSVLFPVFSGRSIPMYGQGVSSLPAADDDEIQEMVIHRADTYPGFFTVGFVFLWSFIWRLVLDVQRDKYGRALNSGHNLYRWIDLSVSWGWLLSLLGWVTGVQTIESSVGLFAAVFSTFVCLSVAEATVVSNLNFETWVSISAVVLAAAALSILFPPYIRSIDNYDDQILNVLSFFVGVLGFAGIVSFGIAYPRSKAFSIHTYEKAIAVLDAVVKVGMSAILFFIYKS
jgi:hypothetical protein